MESMVNFLFDLLAVVKLVECPDGWTLYQPDNTCLRFFGGKKTWYQAHKACRKFDAHLVIIRDEDKNEFVYNMSAEARFTIWIGLKNRERRGFNFKWVDGSDLGDYRPWDAFSPSGDYTKDMKCVGMNGQNTGECAYRETYVCESSHVIT